MNSQRSAGCTGGVGVEIVFTKGTAGEEESVVRVACYLAYEGDKVHEQLRERAR